MRRKSLSAFTIVEMLVVISIITVLIGMLLPAVTKAREQARLTGSYANMRNLAAAHATYASEWEDRQFTLAVDNIAFYGDDPDAAAEAYHDEKGQWPPAIQLGWCTNFGSGQFVLSTAPFSDAFAGNRPNMAPINFDADTGGFGWFRIPNARQFSKYLNSRFYDEVFYAPKDTIALDYIRPGLDSPEEFVPTGAPGGNQMAHIGWSSYCLSPAALFAPQVMRNIGEGGWQDPWTLPAGMRAPSMSQAAYSNLKTHMLEHHWLQSRRVECNPNFADPLDPEHHYGGCEPYYFNHAWQSAPVALFYDGHVRTIGVREAEIADARMRVQTGNDLWGLWSRDTRFGPDGYFIGSGYDFADTSFHILTTDGIRGRDTLGE